MNTHPRSPEWKSKVSAAMRKRWLEPEYVANQQAGTRANPATAERHAKIGESMRQKWANPEYRARMVEAIRQSHAKRKEQRIYAS